MTIPTILFLVGLFAATNALGQDPYGNKFKVVTFKPIKNSPCGPEFSSFNVAPSERALSIIFSKRFLEFGEKNVLENRSVCEFDLVFVKPLTKIESIHIDVRGTEYKELQAAISYSFWFGKTKHKFEYGQGRIIDGTDAPYVRRFQIINLPAGTNKLRMRLEGNAKSTGPDAMGWVAIETIDACILDQEQPESCGSTPIPQQK